MSQPNTVMSSDYPDISLPPGGFKPKIPTGLLANASDIDKWLIEEMSKNTQATEFACNAAISINQNVQKTNGRLKGAEAHIVDLRTEIAQLKADNLALAAQVMSLAPIANTVATTKTLLGNKIFLIILGGFTLFLLGYNREVLPAIFKFFFGG